MPSLPPSSSTTTSRRLASGAALGGAAAFGAALGRDGDVVGPPTSALSDCEFRNCPSPRAAAGGAGAGQGQKGATVHGSSVQARANSGESTAVRGIHPQQRDDLGRETVRTKQAAQSRRRYQGAAWVYGPARRGSAGQDPRYAAFEKTARRAMRNTSKAPDMAAVMDDLGRFASDGLIIDATEESATARGKSH